MTYDTINDMRTIAGNAEGNPSAEKGTTMDKSIGDGPTMRPKNERGGRGAFAPGDVIAGRYVVEKVLGEGGMGIVYQCLDKVGGVSVAVKCLPPEVSRNADEMEDIRANYRLVADLHHPNIAGARTLEVDGSTGDYYLVMDLARGMSLKRWMRRNPQATTEAKLAILRQVAAALDYAHGRKVIHRDVKPENVMVDDEDGVKVLDFGLAAQIRSSQSRTSNTVTSKGGTPGYKSPEQWLGRPQREPADVYSFGVMAYWMFAGELPFNGDDPVVLGLAVLSAPVEPVAGLPAHMNAALVKALAKKPEERFASCGAAVDALEGRAAPQGGGTQVDGGGSVRSPSGPQSARVPRDRDDAPVGSRVPRDRDDAPVGSRVPRDRSGGPRSVAAVKGLLAVVALGLAAFGGWWFASGREGEKGTSGANVGHVERAAPAAKPAAPAVPAPVVFEAGHKGIQLWDGGPYWATTNIGAEKPEDYGYYFWWGDTVGYKCEGGTWVASNGSRSGFSFSEDSTPTCGKSKDALRNEGWITAKGVLAPEHDAAHVQWGGDWRMPTEQELSDLNSNCDWNWTTMNGTQGYVVKGKGAYASASIFLPCCGDGDGTSLDYSGSDGRYWSSVPYSDSTYAYVLLFSSGIHYTDYNYRDGGRSVRPVQGFAKQRTK